jgi:tRNA threonylcarbamoyladenosine biosynthesis protein TsaB
MKILSLDTSGSTASVAILDDNNFLGEYTINNNKTHSQKLVPMINELINSLGISLSEIDYFSAATGPGSFTGLRIGIATIKGMAHALNKPVIGISTLEGLAYNLQNFDGLICPIIDARNKNVYTAVYSFKQGRLICELNHDALHIDDLLQQLKILLSSRQQNIIFLGDAAKIYNDLIMEKLDGSALFAPPHLCLQKASSIAAASLNKINEEQALDTYFNIKPLYIRVSQAERLKSQQ